jgi:hypothetical protein
MFIQTHVQHIPKMRLVEETKGGRKEGKKDSE